MIVKNNVLFKIFYILLIHKRRKIMYSYEWTMITLVSIGVLTVLFLLGLI